MRNRSQLEPSSLQTYCVIVCYHPEIDVLWGLCRTLVKSGASIILVDNTEQTYIAEFAQIPNCTLMPLGSNTGIAHAQNLGIRHAIECGADAVVFFDQDSHICDGFISKLTSPLKKGEPCVVAPVFYDQAQGYEFPALKLDRWGFLRKIYRGRREAPYAADVITSSGSGATADTFSRAGLMDEALFIDFVEFEWCLRCRSKNIPILVVPAAEMKHSVGQASVDLGIMRAFVHSPERCYYQLRNSLLLLLRKKHVPLLTGAKELVSLVIHFSILLGLVRHKRDYLKNLLTAVSDGIRGVTGKKRPVSSAAETDRDRRAA